jgi:hypothetical protein
MRSIPREDVPVVIDDNGVEVRLRDEDDLSVGFVRLPAGADLRPLEDSEYVDFSPTEEFFAGDRPHHVGSRRIRVRNVDRWSRIETWTAHGNLG